MRSEVFIEAIDTHTAGEPTRIITGGIDTDRFAGGSVREQRDRFRAEADELRELLLKEPRGHEDMYGAITVPPNEAGADLGVFFMDTGGYKDMCGHGTMGVVTALIETGYLEPAETVSIETPAGVVTAEPEMTDSGQVERVTVQNVKSYVHDSVTITLPFEREDLEVPVDIVYAGNLFAMVPASAFGLPIEPATTETFIEYGLEIRDRVNEAIDIEDPFTGETMAVDHTEFYEPGEEADRNIVVFSQGAVDRSPCGTGTCGKMTLLYSEDELRVDEPYLHESVIGTRFEGRLRETETRDGITVTTPEVSGSAYIVAEHTFLLDPEDPVPRFSVSTTE